MALFIRRPGLPAALRQAAIYRALLSPTRPFAILSRCYLFVFSFYFAHLLSCALTRHPVHLLSNIKGRFIPAKSWGGGVAHCLHVCLVIQALFPPTLQLRVSKPACSYEAAVFVLWEVKQE